MDGLSILRFPIWILNRLCVLLIVLWLTSLIAPDSLEKFINSILRNVDLNYLLPLASSLSELMAKVNVWVFGVFFLVLVIGIIQMTSSCGCESFWMDAACWLGAWFTNIGTYIVAVALFAKFILKNNTLYEGLFHIPMIFVSLLPFLIWVGVGGYLNIKSHYS